MSAGTKTVSFEAKERKKKNIKQSDIPSTVGPNAIAMGGDPDGTARTNLAGTALRSRTATDEQFPTDSLTKESEQDKIMTEKLELQAAAQAVGMPGVTPFGQLIAKDSDFQWLAGKRDQEAEANFQQWFASNFDRMSPEQKAIARQLFPGYYQQRLAFLKQQVNLQERIARLKIEGIKDRDDMLLQYAIESGYIDSDPLEHILHPEKAAENQRRATAQASFVRGLLNPRRLLRGDWGPRTREENALQLTGRTGGAFPYAAYNSGITGGPGFTAMGAVTNATEKNQNFVNTLGVLPK